jgi:hypothetical protein
MNFFVLSVVSFVIIIRRAAFWEVKESLNHFSAAKKIELFYIFLFSFFGGTMGTAVDWNGKILPKNTKRWKGGREMEREVVYFTVW